MCPSAVCMLVHHLIELIHHGRFHTVITLTVLALFYMESHVVMTDFDHARHYIMTLRCSPSVVIMSNCHMACEESAQTVDVMPKLPLIAVHTTEYSLTVAQDLQCV